MLKTLTDRIVRLASSRNDIVLAVMLVAVVFMMIVPLPTPLVDMLIAINITLAAVLLMVAMYLPSPLAFSSFPSVLLVTTLFRLGISIATTRLILLEGDAGAIVETFGFFVVGGNLIVGLVVFLILTAVQFIVITRGAERVAEVAARFSLDAMPGKQMAIDADLRANAIDMKEALARRGKVEKESQMYGAMDGALKFVKGDAIAGLLIVAVNLLGGIGVGVLQGGLSLGEAGERYAVLTIGDGLIAQIPALFIAICAGIIVTRVQSNPDSDSNVGMDIGAQILAQPKALLISACVALGIGIVPGMPLLVFGSLAIVLAALGMALMRATVSEADASDIALEAGTPGGNPARTNKPAATPALPATGSHAPTVPLMLDVSPDLGARLGAALPAVIDQARQAAFWDVGVIYPAMALRTTETLTGDAFQVLVDEIPTALPASWPTEAPPTVASIQAYIRESLVRQAADFLGIQETRVMLQSCEKHVPELVKECMRVLPIQRVAEILQRLVGERISVRNSQAVLEALVEWGSKEKDTVVLTEYVRIALKRQISFQYADAHQQLPAYLLTPEVEDALRQAVRQTSSGSFLALDPAMSHKIVRAARMLVDQHPIAATPPVLLTSMDIRRYTRKLLEMEIPDVPVLSYQELAPTVQIQPIGSVSV